MNINDVFNAITIIGINNEDAVNKTCKFGETNHSLEFYFDCHSGGFGNVNYNNTDFLFNHAVIKLFFPSDSTKTRFTVHAKFENITEPDEWEGTHDFCHYFESTQSVTTRWNFYDDSVHHEQFRLWLDSIQFFNVDELHKFLDFKALQAEIAEAKEAFKDEIAAMDGSFAEDNNPPF